MISPEQARLVKRDQIAWFLQSEVGQLLRKNHSRLLRATSLRTGRKTPDAPASPDPFDRVMIRGRIDLLVPMEKGLAIIDYKTDNVTPEELPDRTAAYAPQMQFYAAAIQRSPSIPSTRSI